MNRTAFPLAALVLLALVPLAAAPAAAQQSDETLDIIWEVGVLSAVFDALTPYTWTEEEDQAALLYADTKNVVRYVIFEAGRPREAWKSFPLEGSPQHVFAEDLDRDGRPEIVTYTSAARIYVWETEKFSLLWESVEENFEAIQAMAISDVDRDPALEMIVCADNLIYYFDGVEFFREKVGRDFVDPRRMLVADVDGDLTDEIVTSDGYVLDTNSLSIEWANEGFGFPMQLFDINGDGILEVVGEKGGVLQLWSIKDRREIW